MFRYLETYRHYQELLNGKADAAVVNFLSENHYLDAFAKVYFFFSFPPVRESIIPFSVRAIDSTKKTVITLRLNMTCVSMGEV